MFEDQIVERIGRRLGGRGRAGRNLLLGIGDDASILRPAPDFDLVVSSDFSLEGVHFRASYPPEAIGYRSLARAVSDLAAMGAHPAFFLLSIALPTERTGRWLDRMLGGMAKASRQYKLRLIGGDTTRQSNIAMVITVIGRVARGHAIRRDGARVGDRLYVSGELGQAALGVTLLLRQRRSGRSRIGGNFRHRGLFQTHFYPKIPIELGIYLAEHKLASSMIDLSDGLSTDLPRLARASRVGARIFLDRLPVLRVPASLARSGIRPLDLALNGGEDYGLLFSVPAKRAAQVPSAFRGTPIACIGEIVSGRGVSIMGRDGRWRQLPAEGWDPFR